jgi:Lactate dehydrogenase and related dehydrogenases
VDVAACTEAGIALVITPDGVRRPVAVSIITFMLALTGKLMIKDKLTREGPPGFAQRGEHMGVGLVGRTLGSVGIGNIGRSSSASSSLSTCASSPMIPLPIPSLPPSWGSSWWARGCLPPRRLVSISCPLTPETHHLVNAERLALMKPTAYLINTSRGPVVDQKALTRVLQERRIAGAGLDVLEQEPPDPADPILSLDNVILAPPCAVLDRSMLRRQWGSRCESGTGGAARA